MSAYLIAEIEVKDRDTYAEYVAKAPPTVKQYGGRYLVRGGEITTPEGDWHPKRIVVVEFPSMEQLKKWWASPEYSAVAPIRQRSTKSRVIMVEGYSAP